MDWTHWEQEAVFAANRFINEMDEPERWAFCAHSNGISKCLSFYDNVSCDTKLTLEAPTYHDLYKAVCFAWNIHTMANRGF